MCDSFFLKIFFYCEFFSFQPQEKKIREKKEEDKKSVSVKFLLVNITTHKKRCQWNEINV